MNQRKRIDQTGRETWSSAKWNGIDKILFYSPRGSPSGDALPREGSSKAERSVHWQLCGRDSLVDRARPDPSQRARGSRVSPLAKAAARA